MSTRVRSWHGWFRHITLSMLALAFLAALRANGEEHTGKKSLSKWFRHQSRPTLLKPKCLPISRLWFLSASPKSGGFSFVSSGSNHFLLPTTWPGHAGDARIKLSHGFAITSADTLLPVIYNCRIRCFSHEKRGERFSSAF